MILTFELHSSTTAGAPAQCLCHLLVSWTGLPGVAGPSSVAGGLGMGDRTVGPESFYTPRWRAGRHRAQLILYPQVDQATNHTLIVQLLRVGWTACQCLCHGVGIGAPH